MEKTAVRGMGSIVATGIGALLCLGLVIAGLAALFVGGTWRSVRDEIRQDKELYGQIAGSLLVWMDNRDWAEAAIAAFNVHYPDVSVHFETVGSVDSRARVSLDGPAGIGPDVFLMPHDHIRNAINDDIAYPFPAEMRDALAEKLLEAAIMTCTYEGDLYAVPISTESIAFFYNRELLDGNPVPRTFEELKEFAERWNNPAQNRFALRWQVSNPYDNYFFLTAFGFELFGPNMDDFRTPNFDSPEARRGIEFHNNLRRLYNVNTGDATWESTVAAFQRGEVPFTITGPWAIADAHRNGIDFGITKLPTIDGVQPRSFSGNIVAAVSSFSRNIPAATAFVNFLAGVEGAGIQFRHTGRLAAHRDVSMIDGLRDDVLLRGIMEQAAYADPMPTIPEVSQMWDPMAALFTYTWDGQVSIERAQQLAMDRYDLLLRMAGRSRFEDEMELGSLTGIGIGLGFALLIAGLVVLFAKSAKKNKKPSLG
ncbi:MAG: maltose ABC transporter substrate-binding protein [Treponema sp.]|nr:maltose ABC transporter substrate-binding protein [Treponema sp.]